MARFSKIISTIDSHTAGEGTRLVTSGLPPIRGQTVAEKLAYAEEHLAWVPGMLLLEPRGHKDLFGAVLVPPCDPEADVGVLFMDNQGYEPMCGHAVIGLVTSLLETGMFALVEPETVIVLDTPSGLVRAYAQIKDGDVTSVSFDNVPAFVYRSDVALKVPEVGDLGALVLPSFVLETREYSELLGSPGTNPGSKVFQVTDFTDASAVSDAQIEQARVLFQVTIVQLQPCILPDGMPTSATAYYRMVTRKGGFHLTQECTRCTVFGDRGLSRFTTSYLTGVSAS